MRLGVYRVRSLGVVSAARTLDAGLHSRMLDVRPMVVLSLRHIVRRQVESTVTTWVTT
jgi:hypothetical protein